MVKNISHGQTTLDTLKRRSGLRSKSPLTQKSVAPLPDPLSSLTGALGTEQTTPKVQTPYVWVPRNVFTSPEELEVIPEAFEGAAINVRPDEVTKMYDLGNKKRNWARWRGWAFGNKKADEDRYVFPF